jgi:uncharacterized membrane protein
VRNQLSLDIVLCKSFAIYPTVKRHCPSRIPFNTLDITNAHLYYSLVAQTLANPSLKHVSGLYNLSLGWRMSLHLRLQTGLLLLSLVGRFLSRVATEDREAKLSGAAAAWHTVTQKMGDLARNEAGIELKLATNAAPAHSVVIIVTALDRTAPTLVVEQDTRSFLMKVTSKI